MTDRDQSARPSEACEYRDGVPPRWETYKSLAKRYVKELEDYKAQLTEANRRLEIAREIMESLYKRHLWTPGMGECICEPHVKAAEFLAQISSEAGKDGA